MRILGLVAVIALSSACGPTLTRTGGGWHDPDAPYYIAPGPDGRMLSRQWSPISHEAKDGGYRALNAAEYQTDLQFGRREDDGILVVVNDHVRGNDEAKLPSVLVDRWLQENVVSPDGRGYAFYEALVPPLVTTARTSGPTIY